jgi:hypothetical protein
MIDASFVENIGKNDQLDLEVVSKPHLRPNGCVAGLR